MLATDLPPWKIRVCPACHGMISGAGHFCRAARKWSYADGEMIEVVPRSELDELHRELGLIKTLGAEVERLRAALQDALAGCEVAASMTCRCTGYYKCNGCESGIAQQAEDTAEIIRAALADATASDIQSIVTDSTT